MYKFRYKNLYNMADNIRGPLDVVSGSETIDTHLTSADNRHFTLLAILKRPDNGVWQLLKMGNGLPETSGIIPIPAGSGAENALILFIYTEDGKPGPGGIPGVGVYTLCAPPQIVFDPFSPDEDADVSIEITLMPPVIASVDPAPAMYNGNYVNSFDPSVANARARVIHLKTDAAMGGTLSSIISLNDGHNVAVAPHTIGFAYKEISAYIVCYDVVPVTPPNPKPVNVDGLIYIAVSAGVMVGADGWGIVNGHIVHIPGNNPLAKEAIALNRSITAEYKNLGAAMSKLSDFSQKNAKELSQISVKQLVADKGKVIDVLKTGAEQVAK